MALDAKTKRIIATATEKGLNKRLRYDKYAAAHFSTNYYATPTGQDKERCSLSKAEVKPLPY
jgi:hypothetical protein